MLFRLGCLFVLVPILELALLIQVGRWIGVAPTLATVVVTGILGAALARREGIRALTAVQLELAGGRLPTRTLMDGSAVLVGGAFLLTPGVLTDVAGFVLLLPPTRGMVFRWVTARLERAMRSGRLRVSIFNVGGFPGGGGASTGREGEVPGSHGREQGFPFSSGPRSTERDRSPGDHDRDDDEPPPRPGEIVQE